MKMNKLLLHETNMDESYKHNIEQSQTQKDTYSMILLIWSSRTDKANL